MDSRRGGRLPRFDSARGPGYNMVQRYNGPGYNGATNNLLWLCYVDDNHLLDLLVTSMLQPCLVIYSWHWMLCCNCCNINHAKNHEKNNTWR